MQGIDWLSELERAVDKGQRILACRDVAEKNWIIGRPIEDLRSVAQRVADAKKTEVNIVALLPKSEALIGEYYLVPTKIVDSTDKRGNPQISWSLVDTKEAAEMMRDVKYGPSPYFGMQTVEVIKPNSAAPAR